MYSEILAPIHDFLGCTTPKEWLDRAKSEKNILLIDHANCEKKAAATALNLLFRYVERKELLSMLSQLAREELLHFEQVCEYMEKMGVNYDYIPPSRYASNLRKCIRNVEPFKLVDTLIVGAFIEARSCERFAALASVIDDNEEMLELARYYRFLLKSESRHYQEYLMLAKLYFPDGDHAFEERLAYVRAQEAFLISSPDHEFRFHSGVPA